MDPSFMNSPVGNKQADVYAFTNELLEMVFKETRYEIVYKDASWDDMLFGLKEHTADLIISSMPTSYEAEKDFSFSAMFLSLGDIFVTRKNISAANFGDFNGKIIAIQEHAPLLSTFQSYPNVNITYYQSTPQALEEIASSKIDGALIPYISLASFLSEEYRYLLKFSNNKYTNTGLRLVSLKEMQQQVIRTFNTRLATLIEDGSLEKLLIKWNLVL
ncbi:MAG: Arginine-binding extracellular protein ArtP [Chlamydiia bacterium]|nr:Arginine-binding extracellular protein ArtP [Chlamydiia bacterium]